MNNKVEGDMKYILHSLCYITLIENISKEITDFYKFIEDYSLTYIVSFHLIQIGEYVSKLSKDFKEKHEEIDFINIKGLRNIVVHNYDGLDYEDIYSVIKEDIPDLKNKYVNILINEFNLTKKFIEDYIDYFVLNRRFKDMS